MPLPNPDSGAAPDPGLIRLNRRSFVMAAGALTVGVAFGHSPRASAARLPRAQLVANAWVTIGADESITISFAQAEMGQGIMTALPLGIAEELDADWARVRVVQSPTDGATYGVKGTISTFGSTSVKTHFERMRLIGAQARKVLIVCAAARWQVPVAALTTEPGRVIHAATKRSLSYGVLAATATMPNPLPVATEDDLKPTAQFRYIGTALPRVDVPSKVNGSAIYGIDVQPDEMLYAAILRPPVQGETAEAVDEKGARAIPGIVKIATLAGGVVLIGETVEATQRAKRALRVKWSTSAKARTYSIAAVIADYQRAAADPSAPVVTIREDGDARAAIAQTSRTLVADYVANHVAHLCMEPMNATARVADGKVEIWTGSQAPTKVQAAVAKLASLQPEQVVVHSTLLGGGFGRRFEIDFALDAYLAARLSPGRAVKLIFSREDDLAVDPFRPLVAQRLAVGLDADGVISGWWHRVVGESYFARTLPAMMQQTGGKDALIAAGGAPQYKFSNYRSEYLRQDRGVAVGALRGVSSGYTLFAIESMIDEIAALTGQDPLAIRLGLLKDNPRGSRVLQIAAERAGWGKRTPLAGHALGLAYSGDLGSFMGLVVELSMDRARREVKVHHIWCAIDAGLAIQPVNLEAQVEGSLLFGLGVALFEQVTIAQGVVQESNFGEYRVLRMSDLPEMHVEIFSTDHPPSGVGEVGVPIIAPAIANALARLPGGKRVRSLPILPSLYKI